MEFSLPMFKSHSLSKVKYDPLSNGHGKTFCSECGKSLNLVDHLSKRGLLICACIAFNLGISLIMGMVICSTRWVSGECLNVRYAANEIFGESKLIYLRCHYSIVILVFLFQYDYLLFIHSTNSKDAL